MTPPLEHEIAAVRRQAATIAQAIGSGDRLQQIGMLDLRGVDLRQATNDLRKAADALESVACRWEPYKADALQAAE